MAPGKERKGEEKREDRCVKYWRERVTRLMHFSHMCPLFSRRSILAVLKVVNKPHYCLEIFVIIPIFSDKKGTVASRIRTLKPKI